MARPIDATNKAQADLIRKLGGPEEVSGIIRVLCRLDVPAKHVAIMKKRGIPWHLRPALARAAEVRGLALPRGFLGYEVAA